jgi:ribosome-associated protein YbcJ (S4-like RNA binding protein)
MWCLFFLSLSFFSSQIPAQTREISEQEFKKVKDLAYQNTNAENYRKKLKSQHFHNISDQAPYFQRNVTTDHTTNGFYEILEDKRGDKIERTETIEINNRKYLRKNNGQWKDITDPKANEFRGGIITGEIVVNKENAERKYLGKQMLNGQTVDLYEQKITRKYEDMEGLSVNEEKIWIDQNGRYLKTETKSRIGDKHIFQMTVEYEYDASIRISAPKIK